MLTPSAVIDDAGMFAGWYDIAARPKHEHRGVVPTAQIEWELFELVRIYDQMKPRRVLEIGSQCGGTLWWWLGDAEPGTVIVNIDILQNMTSKQANKYMVDWATWPPFGVVLHSVIGRSDSEKVYQQVYKYLGGEIDFLFIDALHTYEGAKYDFETYGKLVQPGGLIVLHDLVTPEFSPHIQVGRFWREVQAAGYKTRELLAGADYGGIGIVYV